jgi:hypothetical protein
MKEKYKYVVKKARLFLFIGTFDGIGIHNYAK